jgi:hypothetical protein
MKLTTRMLQQLIKEEVSKVLREQAKPVDPNVGAQHPETGSEPPRPAAQMQASLATSQVGAQLRRLIQDRYGHASLVAAQREAYTGEGGRIRHKLEQEAHLRPQGTDPQRGDFVGLAQLHGEYQIISMINWVQRTHPQDFELVRRIVGSAVRRDGTPFLAATAAPVGQAPQTPSAGQAPTATPTQLMERRKRR